MRSILKLGGPAVAVVLALAACGGTTGSDDSSAKGGGAKCDLKIGYFGAMTGNAANLGLNIQKSVKLAIDQYNTKHADCKVTLRNFDSQGDETQANSLAQQAVGDKAVIGLVGPTFSGESKVADPVLNEGGLVGVSASATNPKLSTNGWKTFFRVLGNDDTQGPAAAKYIKDGLKAKKVFVVDDASEYGKALAGIVKSGVGPIVAGTDTIQAGQTDFGPTVTQIRSSKADVVFFGGYYAEASLLKKQLVEAGVTATFMGADGIKDDGYIKAAGAKVAEGTIMTCPCLPPEKATGTFFADYKKAYGADPSTYGGEAYDSATIMLDGIASGVRDRPGMLKFVAAYDKDGVTKHLKFDDKGEPTEVKVWAYKVQGGKITTVEEIK